MLIENGYAIWLAASVIVLFLTAAIALLWREPLVEESVTPFALSDEDRHRLRTAMLQSERRQQLEKRARRQSIQAKDGKKSVVAAQDGG